MFRLVAVALGVSLAALVSAQDTKWQPPPTPDGWKAVVSKDGRYRFVIPKDVKGSGTRTRTFSAKGFKAAIEVNYATLKDGTALEVQSAALSGTALKGMSTDQVIDLFVQAEKDDGFTVSVPREVKVGEVKAREYRLSDAKQQRRLVIFAVKPHVYTLEVSAADAAKLDAEAANTFLTSFVLVPDEVVKAQAKERADKQATADKDNTEKLGAKWTADLKAMTPPDAPAVGMVRGVEFKPDRVTLEPGGWLYFRQGGGKPGMFFPDAEVSLWMPSLKPNESVAGKTIEVGKGTNPGLAPHVRISTLPDGAKVPKTEPFVANYTLKLTFGDKDKDGSIPGTIYLCTPDAAKSFVAGKFTVKEK